MREDPACCPFCLSTDPNKVGTEQATGIVCRHEFHCPAPERHGNPWRFCPYCDWREPGRTVTADDIRTFHTNVGGRCTWCGEVWPCRAIRRIQ
jgi:hypothetical protein